MEKTLKTNTNSTAVAKRIIVKVILYLALTLVAIFLVFPYVFMVSRSFMSTKDIMTFPVKFFPQEPSFNAYIEMFTQNNYLLYTLNTFKILICNIITVPIAASLCAYGFAKIKFPGSGAIFGLTLATIMIPGTITQVPLYVLFSSLNWTESIAPLTIPAMFGGGAMNIFLLMQFLKNIPNEMENAAMIDGAGVFRRYWQIVMPLCAPIILYVCVGVFGSVWSDFYGPLLYLKTPEKYTLAIAIYWDSIQTNAAMEAANIRMAAGVFMSIIPALIFLLYQRKLVDGIMIGAIKG